MKYCIITDPESVHVRAATHGQCGVPVMMMDDGDVHLGSFGLLSAATCNKRNYFTHYLNLTSFMYKVFLSTARPNFKKLSSGELMMLKIWRGCAVASIFSKNCHLMTYTNDDEPFTSDIPSRSMGGLVVCSRQSTET